MQVCDRASRTRRRRHREVPAVSSSDELPGIRQRMLSGRPAKFSPVYMFLEPRTRRHRAGFSTWEPDLHAIVECWARPSPAEESRNFSRPVVAHASIYRIHLSRRSRSFERR